MPDPFQPDPVSEQEGKSYTDVVRESEDSTGADYGDDDEESSFADDPRAQRDQRGYGDNDDSGEETATRGPSPEQQQDVINDGEDDGDTSSSDTGGSPPSTNPFDPSKLEQEKTSTSPGEPGFEDNTGTEDLASFEDDTESIAQDPYYQEDVTGERERERRGFDALESVEDDQPSDLQRRGAEQLQEETGIRVEAENVQIAEEDGEQVVRLSEEARQRRAQQLRDAAALGPPGGDRSAQLDRAEARMDAIALAPPSGTVQDLEDMESGAAAGTEAPEGFFEGAEQVAESDLGPGQRAVAYSRLATRSAFGEGAEDLVFQGGFAGNPDETALSGQAINPSPDGPGDILVSGESGELNQELQRDLTSGSGFLSDQQREELREDIEQRREFFGVGEEAEEITTDITGSEEAGAFARGAGQFPGEVAAASAGATLAADTASEIAPNIPGAVEEYGLGEVAYQGLEVGGRATEATVEQAEEQPYQFAGSLAAGLASGYAAGRAIEGAPGRARGASIRARGGDIYDFDDVSDPPRTTSSGLPAYSREAVDDPEVARQEFLEQASETEIGGDSPVAFSGRSPEAVSEYGGFGRRYEAPEGGSELPGQFFSADLSALRVSQGGSSGYSIPRPGLPRPNVRSSRVLAEEGVDVDAIPSRFSGSGYAVRQGDDIVETGLSRAEANRLADETGGERVPDPTSGGYQFLTEEADTRKSYVRDEGDITPEQEVVAPPEATFAQSEGVFGIRVGGRQIPFTDRRIGGEIIPGRLTRRVDVDANDLDDGADIDTLSQSEVSSETTDAIGESLRRQEQPRLPFVPVGAPSGGGSVTEETTPSRESPSFFSIGYSSPGGTDTGSDTGFVPTSPTAPISPGASEATPAPSGGGSSGIPTGGPTSATSPPGGSPTPPPSGPTSPPGPVIPGEPPTQDQPPDLPESDADSDVRDEPFGGVRSEELTDFINPLTGEVIKTEGGN